MSSCVSLFQFTLMSMINHKVLILSFEFHSSAARVTTVLRVVWFQREIIPCVAAGSSLVRCFFEVWGEGIVCTDVCCRAPAMSCR